MRRAVAGWRNRFSTADESNLADDRLVHFSKKRLNNLSPPNSQSGIERFLIEILKSGRYHAKTLQSPLRYPAFIVGVALFGAFQATQTA